MMTKDLEILNNPRILLKKKENYLYGASSAGRQIAHLLNCLEIPVTAFVDSDVHKCGGVLEEIPIVSAQSLKSVDASKLRIIISSCYVNEIMNTLKQLGLSDCVEVCTGWSVRIACFFAGITGEDYLDDAFKEQCRCVHNWLGIDREMGARISDNVFLKALLNDDQYLIINPLKVGSVTIYDSLYQSNKIASHGHTLIGNRCLIDEEAYSEQSRRKDRKELLESLGVRHHLKIITGIREPISHGISMYWQFLDEIYWHENIEHQTIQQSCLDFIKKYTWLAPAEGEKRNHLFGYLDNYRQNRKYGWEFDWYDQCIKQELGVDVYAYPFDKEKGYTVIKTDYMEIFLYRLEDLNNLEKELAEFIDCPEFHLISGNRNTDKEYQFAYKEFMKVFKVPQELVDFYYKDNPYMDHFYSEEQKQEMVKRWL